MESVTQQQPTDNQAVKVDTQGRALLPKHVREELGVKGGGEVVLSRDENGRLYIESKQQVLKRLQARFAHIDVSLADELIQDRRAEAAREAAE